ncbi:MAG: ABC transporter permease [Bacteroidetes bacterium]|nr:ABC transporter permease [Bacteroidota bacterium]
MIRNFIKTTLRNLLKNKAFTAINILGLALGLATCLLIVFYVSDELSFDKFNRNFDRIYRADEEVKYNGDLSEDAVCPAPLAATLAAQFPEIAGTVRFRQAGNFQVRKGTQDIHEDQVTYCDNSVFKVFTLPMIDGNPNTALSDPNSVVITESMAKKYFNRINVVGQTLTFNDNKPFKVTGVIKDIPQQSHFRFDFFLSMPTLNESRENSWLSSNFQTYLLLKPGTTPAKISAALPKIVHDNVGAQLEAALHTSFSNFEKSGNRFKMMLTPLGDIHLRSNKIAEMGPNGNIQYVYIFSAIALFILLIACVNFMNLSTARSAGRAREVGVRKVLGSPRQYLIIQFLTESVMVTFAAALIAIVAAYALLPLFNQLSGKELVITPHLLIVFVPVLFVAVLVIGCLAGSYPAIFLSAFRPVQVLKGKLAGGFGNSFLRSFLVVFQFAISIFLIIGTLVIYNQLKYIQNKDLGYNRSQVLTVYNVSALGQRSALFKQQVKQLPGVSDATLTGFVPVNGWRSNGSVFKDRGMNARQGTLTQLWDVDQDYIPTLDMKLLTGRNFSDQMPTDSSAMIVNESAARLLGLTDPVNKNLYRPLDDYGKNFKTFHVIGVIKDFNFSSLRDNIGPLILMYQPNNAELSVKIKTSDATRTIGQLKNIWNELAPAQQFSYAFMNEDFDHLYQAEQRMGTLSFIFTSLAVIIACLGLFGLAAYAAEQRTKEIGIRKVLGAKVSTIVSMLSIDFIKLVAIAIVLAAPPAWWAMQHWLQGFAYRQDVPWWSVAFAAVSTIVIAFGTISFQSVKAALTNPVKSLRSE